MFILHIEPKVKPIFTEIVFCAKRTKKCVHGNLTGYENIFNLHIYEMVSRKILRNLFLKRTNLRATC